MTAWFDMLSTYKEGIKFEEYVDLKSLDETK